MTERVAGSTRKPEAASLVLGAGSGSGSTLPALGTTTAVLSKRKLQKLEQGIVKPKGKWFVSNKLSELPRRCLPGSRSWPGDAGLGLGAGQEMLARVSELARRCWPGSWRCCFPGSRSCWPGSRSCSGGAGLGLAQEGVPALPGHGALGEAHSCQCRRPSLPCSILADHYRHVPIRIPLKTQACPCYSSWPRWPRQCP